MFERFLVPDHRRCLNTDQQMEDGLQRNQAAFFARKPDAERFCGTSERNPKGRMKNGPEEVSPSLPLSQMWDGQTFLGQASGESPKGIVPDTSMVKRPLKASLEINSIGEHVYSKTVSY